MTPRAEEVDIVGNHRPVNALTPDKLHVIRPPLLHAGNSRTMEQRSAVGLVDNFPWLSVQVAV